MSKDRTRRQSKWGNKLEKWEDTEMRGPEAGWLGRKGSPPVTRGPRVWGWGKAEAGDRRPGAEGSSATLPRWP